MRCARAQRLMVAAADAELAPRRRAAFERHLASCPACHGEAERTARVLHEVAGLPSERPVSAQLEQATLRRVRVLAAEEAEREPFRRRWWGTLRVPAFAVASFGVVVLAVGLYRATGVPEGVRRAAAPPVKRAATPKAPPQQVARRDRERNVPRLPPPSEPPPELAAAPDLFVDLPILRNMEKLEHFDAISATALDEDGQSNG